MGIFVLCTFLILFTEHFFCRSANYIKQKSRENQLLTVQERLPSPGTCFTWGGAHYKTFDNKIFSATSDCAHTLVRDANDNIFSIVLQNSPECLKNDQSSCYRIIKLYVQDKEYTLMKDENNSEVSNDLEMIIQKFSVCS